MSCICNSATALPRVNSLRSNAIHHIISCEHAGNKVPQRYRPLFARCGNLLASHRGYDIGALNLARFLSRALGAPLHSSAYTRLLVDLNRSQHHPRLFSKYTKTLNRAEKERLLSAYYHRYRQKITGEITRLIEKNGPVLHLSIHTFTPRLDNQARNADIGLLYDPKRLTEKELCLKWQEALQQAGLAVRRNYPYRGIADGLTSHLRKIFPSNRYLGIEVEVNQKHFAGTRAGWRKLAGVISNAIAPGVS